MTYQPLIECTILTSLFTLLGSGLLLLTTKLKLVTKVDKNIDTTKVLKGSVQGKRIAKVLISFAITFLTSPNVILLAYFFANENISSTTLLFALLTLQGLSITCLGLSLYYTCDFRIRALSHVRDAIREGGIT